ncbi:MAG: DUF4139 domain-containing protein [Endomicrobia bacterium]|nr:DUF4139 domain-containing protein [Endomicrobiia bacterium]
MKTTAALILCAAFLSTQFAYADVALTVYNGNRALVRETREVNIKKGAQTLEFDNVAAQIDPTSVLPKFLTEPSKISILEQNFDYDLIDTNKLLSKYIGKDIEIERTGKDKRKNVKGRLLSVYSGLVVQSDGKIVLNPEGEVKLPEIPEGLRLKPTLTWLLDSSYEGANKMEVSYQTGGIGWNADYVLVTDEKDTQADITGWVTINNASGATYKDAKLKLIAGDVNMIQPAAALNESDKFYDMADVKNEAPSFQEKSFFEYHIYELQRKATVKDNEIKQIEFVTASKIPVKKVLTYNGSRNQKVTVNLEFKNSKENNLGMPLPAGRVRVCKYDGSALEFVGEDMIDHTAKDAKLSIYTGNSFDVTGERVQTNYKAGSKWEEQSYKITIKNSKNEAVEVNVVESFYNWVNWEISENSAKFDKKDSQTAEFLLKVPANSEKILTYKVKYTWK